MARINLAEYPFAYYQPDPISKIPVLADLSTALSVGGSLLSGAMGSDAASNAADASAKATAASNAALQKQATDNTAAYKPYTDTGTAANNKLSYYLGLTPTSSTAAAPTTTQVGQSNDPTWNAILNGYQNAYTAKYGKPMDQAWDSTDNTRNQYKLLQDEYAAAAPKTQLDTSDGQYGSLMKNFSASDLAADPVYNSGLQFGLDQGIQGLNRQAAATGSLNSGATLKALTKYANDYGSTKAQTAYNNFNTNKSNTYNMLSGQSAQGLQATSSLTGNNTNLMTGQANNTMANGTNQGNAAIASGSAWGNAINGGIGNYLYNQRTATTAPIAGNSTYGGGYNQSAGSVPWYA
jgi:hypothetical protein